MCACGKDAWTDLWRGWRWSIRSWTLAEALSVFVVTCLSHSELWQREVERAVWAALVECCWWCGVYGTQRHAQHNLAQGAHCMARCGVLDLGFVLMLMFAEDLASSTGTSGCGHVPAQAEWQLMWVPWVMSPALHWCPSTLCVVDVVLLLLLDAFGGGLPSSLVPLSGCWEMETDCLALDILLLLSGLNWFDHCLLLHLARTPSSYPHKVA